MPASVMTLAGSNTRLPATEAVLTPATAVAFAVVVHHWSHQPWWATVTGGIAVALLTGGVRWWTFRR